MTTPAITHDDARAVARYRRAYLSGDFDWSPSPAETLATAKAISDALGLPVDEDSFEAAINPRGGGGGKVRLSVIEKVLLGKGAFFSFRPIGSDPGTRADR